MSISETNALELPKGYKPSVKEPFMNKMQVEYFRLKLLNWREELLAESRDTINMIQNDSLAHADIADRASSETDHSLELRASDRQRKLVNKIQAALRRIDEGSFGYCEETGEPISLKRLEARPVATLSIEAQEHHERNERLGR